MHLMDQLLEYNPDKRITAEKALEHPYLSQYHQPGDEVNSYIVRRSSVFIAITSYPVRF